MVSKTEVEEDDDEVHNTVTEIEYLLPSDEEEKLVHAARDGEYNVIEQLFRASTTTTTTTMLDVNCTITNHWTSLHWAAFCGHADIITLLIHHNANVDCQTNKGWTPLHFACYEGRFDIVKILLQNGADSYLTNDVGQTPKDIAQEAGYDMIANYISLFQFKSTTPSAVLKTNRRESTTTAAVTTEVVLIVEDDVEQQSTAANEQVLLSHHQKKQDQQQITIIEEIVVDDDDDDDNSQQEKRLHPIHEDSNEELHAEIDELKKSIDDLKQLVTARDTQHRQEVAVLTQTVRAVESATARLVDHLRRLQRQVDDSAQELKVFVEQMNEQYSMEIESLKDIVAAEERSSTMMIAGAMIHAPPPSEMAGLLLLLQNKFDCTLTTFKNEITEQLHRQQQQQEFFYSKDNSNSGIAIEQTTNNEEVDTWKEAVVEVDQESTSKSIDCGGRRLESIFFSRNSDDDTKRRGLYHDFVRQEQVQAFVNSWMEKYMKEMESKYQQKLEAAVSARVEEEVIQSRIIINRSCVQHSNKQGRSNDDLLLATQDANSSSRQRMHHPSRQRMHHPKKSSQIAGLLRNELVQINKRVGSLELELALLSSSSLRHSPFLLLRY